jgi:vitamin B12 transporter
MKAKILVLILAIGAELYAQTPTLTVVGEEIVVTATRAEERIEHLPLRACIITKEQIRDGCAKRLEELLRQFTSIPIAQCGGAGKSTSLYLRGANKGQTLILIDGVEMNDPSNVLTGGRCNIAHIATEDIERVEILYGPAGVLYGSDAMAGLINIVTGVPKGTSLSFSGGSFKSPTFSFKNGGSLLGIDYGLSFSYFETDGISCGEGEEPDGYKNRTISLYSRIKPSIFELSARFRKIDAENEYDRWDRQKKKCVDANNIEDFGNRLFSTDAVAHISERVKATLRAYSLKTEREYRKEERLNSYTGETEKLESFCTLKSAHSELIMGAEIEKDLCKTEKMRKSTENKALYFQNSLRLKNILVRGGFRIDDHKAFGSYKTHNLSLQLSLGDVRFWSGFSEGFKAPLLYQLYAPPMPSMWFSGGNPKLEPEECESLELGAEIRRGRFSLSTAHFKTEYSNLISYYTDPATSQGTYKNVGTATIEGNEIGLSIAPAEGLRISFDYTHFSKCEGTDGRLNLRPESMWVTNIEWDLGRLRVFADITHVGERHSSERVLPEYTLFGISGSLKLSEVLTVNSRVSNISDTEYEEVAGYNAPGRSFYFGTEFRL